MRAESVLSTQAAKETHVLTPYTTEEVGAIQGARTFMHAAEVAIAVLDRYHAEGHTPVSQVCGPISTGGLGCRERNVERFAHAIEVAHAHGCPLFDQRPFEVVIKRLSPSHTATTYDESILTEFYAPILRSGRIVRLLFLPGWTTSRGARWERKFGKSVGLQIEDYPFPLEK